MAFKKGQSGNPKGRPKGIASKTTEARREFIKNLLDGEKENIKLALERTLKRSPGIYLNVILSLMEFDIPKLARTEVINEGETVTTVLIEGENPFKWEIFDNSPQETQRMHAPGY